MKKMNSKGFLLAESLVVSTFVLTVLVFLFFQFKSLFNSYSDSYDYNTVEAIYNLNTMKKYIISDANAEFEKQNLPIFIVNENGNRCSDLFKNHDHCELLVDKMNLQTLIYIKSDANLNTEGYSTSFRNFIQRIENVEGQHRLIGQFEDGTYGTIVFE